MQVKTADIHRDERMPLILAAAAVLLGASAFAKVAGFYVGRGRMQGLAGLGQTWHDPNGTKDCLSRAKKAADAIKQNNLFVKEPPKEHPIKQVDGILGNEVFIGDKWYKAGDKVGDAGIVEVTPTYVKVEWNGKEQNFAPIGAAASESPSPAAKEVKKEPAPEEPKPAATAKAARVEASEPVEENDPLGWLGVKLSPRLRAALLTKWNSASDEEKAKAKEEWDKMSDNDKQQAVDQMEQHVDDIR